MSNGWLRKAVLLAVLGALLSIGVSQVALSQEAGGKEVSATGPVSATNDPEEGRIYYIEDRATGTPYRLFGDADFESYVGKQATAYGVVEGGDVAVAYLRASRIGPPEGGGYTIQNVVANFDLTVEGEPPDDAEFWGNWGANSVFGSTRLTDPDGDGVYTGSKSASIPVDSEGVVGLKGPHPVWIELRGKEDNRVIEDFGRVTLRAGDNDFSAKVSFEDEGVEKDRFIGKSFTGTEDSDAIRGGSGDDLLRGKAGDDLLVAEAGADRVEGGSGDDALYAAYDVPTENAPNAPASGDLLYGGTGDDFIDASDAPGSPDAVYCGSGGDLVVADAEDFVADDCEAVYRY